MWIPIFRTGTFTSMEGKVKSYTEADLDNMASLYNNQPADKKRTAPHVLGHPEHNAPSYGWVQELKREGDTLLAYTDNFVDEFKNAVNKGLYKFRSAQFYGNGLLRHVGWLGASQPAVAGLGEVSFADGDEEVFTYTEEQWRWRLEDVVHSLGNMLANMRDFHIEKHGRDDAEKIFSSWQIQELMRFKLPNIPKPEPTPAPVESGYGSYAQSAGDGDTEPPARTTETHSESQPMSTETKAGEGTAPNTAELASYIEENKALKAQLDAQVQAQKALTEQVENLKRENDRQRFTSFCQNLVAEGKMLPADVEYHVEDLMAKASITSFAEGTKSPLQRTMEHLASQPNNRLQERVATNGNAPEDGKPTETVLSFMEGVDARRFGVDQDALKTFQRAQDIAKERNITLAEAAIIAEREG